MPASTSTSISMATAKSSFETSNAELIRAIHRVDRETLNAILINMCKSSPECLLQASKSLLVSQPSSSAIRSSDGSGSDVQDEKTEGQKRKRPTSEEDDDLPDSKRALLPPLLGSVDAQPRTMNLPALPSLLQTPVPTSTTMVSRFERCEECDEIFDVSENHGEACVTHPGIREIQDAWYEDFDHIEGEPDPDLDDGEDWRIGEWPQYFLWDCCGQPADAAGCRVRRHQRC